jgi:hypothetical protein
MSLEVFLKDLENVTKALEQSLNNHNVLCGQKQALEHVIGKLKEAAPAEDVKVVEVAPEDVISQ